MPFRDFPLQFDRRGGSLKIFLSCGWFCIKAPFPHECIPFSLGKAGWYCATKGRIFFRAFCLSLLVNDVSLSENLTSERCFTTSVAAGQPLFLRCAAKFLMFSSKVVCEEFFLRSLNGSSLMKPFVTPGRRQE